MNTQLRTLSLKCPSCGALLDINPETDHFACGYCGTGQIVQRQGGIVALKPVTEAISRVQIGTDRTAAELAIRRITDELNALIERGEQITLAIKRSSDRRSNGLLFALGVACLFLGLSGFASGEGPAMGFGVVFIGLGPLLVVRARRNIKSSNTALERLSIAKTQNIEHQNALRSEIALQKAVVAQP